MLDILLKSSFCVIWQKVIRWEHHENEQVMTIKLFFILKPFL